MEMVVVSILNKRCAQLIIYPSSHIINHVILYTEKRKISCDPTVTTPNSGGKGDITLSSSTTAVAAAVTDVDKSGDTGKPTHKTKGTIPTLPFPGSGGSTTESGSDVVGVVGGAGDTASKPKPKPRTKKANQQQKASIAGASSGGVATSGGGKVAESGVSKFEEKAVDTALPGAPSPQSQKMRVEQVKNATELKKDREEYNQNKEVFRHLTEIDLKSGKDHKVKIAHTSVKSIQAGLNLFNAKVSMHPNTEGNYARLAVEVGYNYFYSGPLDPSSVEQARKVLDNFTPLVEKHWKYFEEGRKLQPLGKEVDGKALEDAASE